MPSTDTMDKMVAYVSWTFYFLYPQIALFANLVHILISLGFHLEMHSLDICAQIEKFRLSFCFHLVVLPLHDHTHQTQRHPPVGEFDQKQVRLVQLPYLRLIVCFPN